MDVDRTEELLSDSVTIPTLPSVVHRINRMLQDPEVSLGDIGAEVAKDAPISTKVLRIANSAFYGLRERVMSTEHASCVLGLQVLRNIVMQASVIGHFEHISKNGEFDLEGLWRHSILTAECCQSLARRAKVPLDLAPEEFHTTGLLHDIGQVVLLDAMPDEFLRAVRTADELGCDLAIAEQEVFGFDHAAVGAKVAQRWGLPPLLERAIGEHHRPLETHDHPAILLVAVANRMCEVAPSEARDEVLATFDPLIDERLGVDEASYVGMAEFVVRRYPEIEV